ALSVNRRSPTAYLLNRRWTFTSRGDTREVSLGAGVYVLTFIIGIGINGLAVRLLPDWPARLTLAWLISQGTATIFNFALQRALVFRRRTKTRHTTIDVSP